MKTWAVVLIIVLAIVGGVILMRTIPENLTYEQIYQLAVNAGFSGNDLRIAVAIALAESTGNPGATGDITLGMSYGLWQINSKYHPEFGPDFTRLYDPQTNANAAYAVYLVAGHSFSPWSTFKSGAYTKYLQGTV